MTLRAFTTRAVLFDFDGTLTAPGALDWQWFRKKLGCPKHMGILEYIEAEPDPARRSAMEQELERYELVGADRSRPAPGAGALVLRLRAMGLALGIITRNSRSSVDRAFLRFDDVGPGHFDLIITRETPVPPKPAPDGIFHAARRLKIDPAQILVVGDFRFDIEAGSRAGAVTVRVGAEKAADTDETAADFTVSRIEEVAQIVRLGIPMTGGKLPNDLLEHFLAPFSADAPDLLVRPGIGQDTAAVDIGGKEVLVLKSDPITFVTDAIGQYAVVVNANDIATSGAVPRWFLTTLLFPPGTTPSRIRQVMAELDAVCRRLNILLVGGHTEVTDAVTRPVVTGMLSGTVRRPDLIDKAGMRTGHRVLMTKAVAVEGTAIVAREFGDRLRELGLAAAEIRKAADFLSRISILPEARIAARFSGVSAMHDVTEGGLATAVEEFGTAGGHRLGIELDRIPIYPETDRICRVMGLKPLGLIGSGSLLIACRPDQADPLIEEIRRAGIEAACIGEVLEAGRGVEVRGPAAGTPWPAFETDEITRLFS